LKDSVPGADAHGSPDRVSVAAPELIWGIDCSHAIPIDDCDCDSTNAGSFRWLHLSLAHQGTIAWIAHAPGLPAAVRDLLLSPETHQYALIDSGIVGCVLHDFERDFDSLDVSRVGALRFALAPSMMITARLHPIRSADLIQQKLLRGPIGGAAAALDMLVGTVSEGIAATARELSVDVQKAEDAFLEGHHPPTARELIGIRRRLAQLHRMLDGMRMALRRLEEDEELPESLLATIEKLSQRLQALDADALSVQGQLRLLREEIDIQQDQRTNQNLYILSIMTALLLPATLVTGIFGMNTGGLPWATTPLGTVYATLLALGTATTTYALLRWMGFMRR
jgi:zinc transporter